MSVTRSRPSPTRPGRPRPAVESGSTPDAPPKYFWQVLADQFRPEPQVYRRLVVTLASLMAVFSIFPLANNVLGWQNKDYDLWYLTGQKFLHGIQIYPTDHRPFPFMYPPTAAALMAVASVVGSLGFVGILLVLQSAAWLGSILLSVRLATGKTLRQSPILYMVPTLCVIPFVHDMYLLGQPNLLLLWLMLGALACLRGNRPWSAGALIGLAAGIKAFPILALGYLVYRRQWKATASTVLSLAVLLLVVPLPFRGPSKAVSDLVIWTKGMVLKYDEGQIAQRPERCYSFKNQSLLAVTNRLLRDLPADGERKDPWQVNVASLDFKTVNKVAAAAGLALCLFYVATMPWRRPGTGAGGGRVYASETAMLVLMVLVFSPFAFNYFYVWLIYPLTVAISRLLDAPAGSREARARRRPGTARLPRSMPATGLLVARRPGVREPARRRPRAAGAARLAARARPFGDAGVDRGRCQGDECVARWVPRDAEVRRVVDRCRLRGFIRFRRRRPCPHDRPDTRHPST